MNKASFLQKIGSTSACMKRLSRYKKGCGQLMSNDTYFSGSWFSLVKTSEDGMAEGVDYCGLVNTSHRGFCLATL